MEDKKWETYLDEVLSFVKFKYDHKAIRRELAEHMADLKEDLMAEGMDEEAAEYMTIAHMGDAAEIGQELNKEHHVLLGWIWRISRILVACLIGANIMPIFTFVTGVASNLTEGYVPHTEAPLVWQIELDKEYQIYDDTLILEDVYYYEDSTLEVFYRTKRSPLARSVDWSLSVFLRVFDEDGSEIGNGGGGYKSGGYYGVGTDYKREIPADAKTLGIYCSDLIVMVDLETGEVTEDAKT